MRLLVEQSPVVLGHLPNAQESPTAVEPAAGASTRTPANAPQRQALAIAILLVGVLFLVAIALGLRWLRRFTERDARSARARTAAGLGRDPWREAARRLVVPPVERSPEGEDDDGEDRERRDNGDQR